MAHVLHEAGYEAVEQSTHPHPDRERRFERAQPNQLWQTDLFTFVLKRQNRRVYLVAFLDDHSRFVVSYGRHASQLTALVLEVLEAGIASYGPPEEILTDNGAQYVTWRGKSQFSRRLEQRGIRQLVSRPQRPQTLGKSERFWGTLWREFLESAVFADLAEARRRIGHFMDYDNFQRPHRGADGLVPADRFFQAAPTVLQTLKERVAANALELARYGQPQAPFYVTGQVGGQAFSVHAEGERLVLRRQGQEREEIELTSPADSSPGTTCSSAEGLTVLLETLRGELPVPEACQRLGICASRFHELRGEWLQEALELLEPGPLGRPPRQAEAAPLPSRIQALEAENRTLRQQLTAAELRRELAEVLPHVVPTPGEAAKKGRPLSRLGSAAGRVERPASPRVPRPSGRRRRRASGVGDGHRLASRCVRVSAVRLPGL